MFIIWIIIRSWTFYMISNLKKSFSQSPPLERGFKGEKMIVVPKSLIKKYADKEIISNLQLTDIGYFPNASHHFRERPNGCPEYILIYCIEGEGIVTIDRKRYLIHFLSLNRKKPIPIILIIMTHGAYIGFTLQELIVPLYSKNSDL